MVSYELGQCGRHSRPGEWGSGWWDAGGPERVSVMSGDDYRGLHGGGSQGGGKWVDGSGAGRGQARGKGAACCGEGVWVSVRVANRGR